MSNSGRAQMGRALTHRNHPLRTMTMPSHKPQPAPPPQHQECGYALVALLALMTILVLLMMSVAPSLRQQAVREREKEAIARGEEVADAIALYTQIQNAP